MKNNTPPKTKKPQPLKRNDAWKTTFPFWVLVNFQGGELLNILGGEPRYLAAKFLYLPYVFLSKRAWDLI